MTFSNLSKVYSHLNNSEIKDIQKKFYHFFSDHIVETIKYLSISEDEIRKRVRFTNTEIVNEVLERGQHATVYLGHYGNWEWFSSIALHLPKNKVAQIYHRLENPIMDNLFLSMRERFNAKSIEMSETKHIINKFRAGESLGVGYIADQVPLYSQIHHFSNFMGISTPVFTGAERIAKLTNSAVFYIDIKVVKRGYYEAELIKIADNINDLAMFEATDKYFELLEKTIRRAPEYWLWSHNRWKRDLEGLKREFPDTWEKRLQKL